MEKSILFKRPVITLFLFYAAFLIFLNAIGVFKPQKQSFLYHFTNYYKPVSIEGRIISVPEKTKNGQKFILKASKINDFAVKEKILINSPAGYNASYGDIINIEGRISKPKKADFPLVFDYSQYLARLGIYTIANIYSFEYIESKPNPVKKFAMSFQQDIVKKIDNYFKKAYADVLKPIIIGDKTALDAQTKENFIDAGLMHILVVSGLHVGFVGGMLLVIFKLSGLPLKKASLLSIPFIFLYVLSTGANPPALRAAIMFSSVLIALALDREPLIYNSLALSALIILIFQPQQLFTASFQMSYAATIGIIYFYRNIYSVFGNIKNSILKFFCGVFSVTLSAQIVLIPVCMYYFGKISIISFLANIIVVPLIGIITPMGFIFYFFTFIFPYISLFVSAVISVILHFIISVVNIAAGFSFSTAAVAKPAIFNIFLFFLFLFLITYFKDKKRFISGGICLLISLFSIAVPKLIAKDRAVFNIYDGKNITAIQAINNNLSAFILYQKTGRYDKYYIDSFRQFLSFSGIKKAEITLLGFNEADEIEKQLQNMDLKILKSETPKVLDMNFREHKILFDMEHGKIYLDENGELKIKDNPSFYYYCRGKRFKIKNPRR